MLLYIIANSKSEEMSSSRTVSRSLVNAILEKVPDVELEELDLYKDHIPQLKGAILIAEVQSLVQRLEVNFL
jgi:FMN-dependent NADH-azoreductase